MYKCEKKLFQYLLFRSDLLYTAHGVPGYPSRYILGFHFRRFYMCCVCLHWNSNLSIQYLEIVELVTSSILRKTNILESLNYISTIDKRFTDFTIYSHESWRAFACSILCTLSSILTAWSIQTNLVAWF